jgi:L-ascorbate metabolism protein UlaG (beta-lactamase superfamily)
MKITKFEQSGFIIESEKGGTLGIDIGVYTPLEKLAGIQCDAVIASHIHGDHFNIERIKALSPQKIFLNHECIETLGEESLSFDIQEVKVGDVVQNEDFSITFFNVDHGPNVSAPLAENFGLLVEVDGQTVFFCGDMYVPSGMSVEDLELDYLLLPVGGHYTFGPQEALSYAQQFKKVGTIIPMHYEKNNFVDPSQCERFMELVDDSFSIQK